MKGALDKRTDCAKVRGWQCAGHARVNLLSLLEHSSGRNDGNAHLLQVKGRHEGHAYPYKIQDL